MVPLSYQTSPSLPPISMHRNPSTLFHKVTRLTSVTLPVVALRANTAGTGSVHRTLLLMVMGRLRPWRSGNLAKTLECALCRIFFGVVDVLSVVPVARLDVLTCDLHGATPCSAATCQTVSMLLCTATVGPESAQTSPIGQDLPSWRAHARALTEVYRRELVGELSRLERESLLLKASCFADCPAVDDGVDA